MFSYLRPHRRTPSAPSSPEPLHPSALQPQTWDPQLQQHYQTQIANDSQSHIHPLFRPTSNTKASPPLGNGAGVGPSTGPSWASTSGHASQMYEHAHPRMNSWAGGLERIGQNGEQMGSHVGAEGGREREGMYTSTGLSEQPPSLPPINRLSSLGLPIGAGLGVGDGSRSGSRSPAYDGEQRRSEERRGEAPRIQAEDQLQRFDRDPLVWNGRGFVREQDVAKKMEWEREQARTRELERLREMERLRETEFFRSQAMSGTVTTSGAGSGTWESTIPAQQSHTHQTPSQQSAASTNRTESAGPEEPHGLTSRHSSGSERRFAGGIKYTQQQEQMRTQMTTTAGFQAKSHSRSKQRPPDLKLATKYGPSPPPKSQVNIPDSQVRQRPKDPHPIVTDHAKSVTTGKRPVDARYAPVQLTPSTTLEPVSKPNKTRLNLLNPMTLLARRRNSQANTQIISPDSPKPPGDDSVPFVDPRIKGTVVHDFSAPRPRKKVSTNDTKDPKKQYANARGEVGERVHSPHTPVFTEDFEEEQFPAAGPHVRKANDTSDLPLPAPPYANDTPKPQAISKGTRPDISPALAKSSLPSLPLREVHLIMPGRTPPPPPVPEEEVVESRRISIDQSSTPPKSYSSSRKGRSRNSSGVSAKDAALLGLPKHMKSTSSRFSFDMIGAAEQERLLEDRHRQRQLEKKLNGNDDDDDRLGEVDDEFDYDAMMDDDGLEERIPGVNADLDEEDEDLGILEEEIPGLNVEEEEEVPETSNEVLDLDPLCDINDDPEGLLWDTEKYAGFTFHQLDMPLTPGLPMVHTPRDAEGNAIGFAVTKNSPRGEGIEGPVEASDEEPDDNHVAMNNPQVDGLGIGNLTSKQTPYQSFPNTDMTDLRQGGLNDDELYFDDGLIDQIDIIDAIEFDESVFDNIDTDEYGRPIKSFSSIPTAYSPPNITNETSPQLDQDESRLSDELIKQSLAPRPLNFDKCTRQSTYDLTQSSLEAYQTALAAAAQKAALSGKFDRNTSSLEIAAQTTSFPPYDDPDDPSSQQNFDDDSVLSDDAIIAAANAEALASDTDGFYGTEFGFYSAPPSATNLVPSSALDTEGGFAMGGYFGPLSIDGIHRSGSGRQGVVSREPNLTPITERSEYSNRNSFMSILHARGQATGGGTGQSEIGSPGLAQLMIEEGEGWGFGMLPGMGGGIGAQMSLDALLKLRRGAWGGGSAPGVGSGGGSTGETGSASGEGSEGSPISGSRSSIGHTWRGRVGSGFSGVSEMDELFQVDELGSFSQHSFPPHLFSQSGPDLYVEDHGDDKYEHEEIQDEYEDAGHQPNTSLPMDKHTLGYNSNIKSEGMFNNDIDEEEAEEEEEEEDPTTPNSPTRNPSVFEGGGGAGGGGALSRQQEEAEMRHDTTPRPRVKTRVLPGVSES